MGGDTLINYPHCNGDQCEDCQDDPECHKELSESIDKLISIMKSLPPHQLWKLILAGVL